MFVQRPTCFYYPSWNAYNYGMRRNIFYNNSIGTNNNIVTYRNITYYLSASLNFNIISDIWAMNFIAVSNCHLLINPTIASNMAT